MEKLYVNEISKMINGEIINTGAINFADSVCIDSRKALKNSIFFAMSGTSFDGHDFAKQAYQNGASIIIVKRKIKDLDAFQIKVDDTFKALYQLAKSYKNKFDVKFIALTGSAGKTTTKDLIASVLSEKYNTMKTIGNFNSSTGVPLTLFNLDKKTEIAVIEMGMDSFGEIKRSSELVNPDIALITNIGLTHLEKLGSKKNIFKAKQEIFSGLKKDGITILNVDDEYLKTLKGNIITISINNESDYKAQDIIMSKERVDFEVLNKGNKSNFSFFLPAIHNVYNSLFAIAIGKIYNLSDEEIRNGLKNFVPSENRMSFLNINNKTIINDTYNSNPDALKSTIELLKTVSENNKSIAVLGDMYELGEKSEEEHYKCGEFLAKNKIDFLITYGLLSINIAKGAIDNGFSKNSCIHFTEEDDLIDFLIKNKKDDYYYLFKASRGVKLDDVVNKLIKEGNF